MRLGILIGVAGALLCLAPTSSAADELSARARRGRAAMKQAECTRCHNVTDGDDRGRGLAAAPRSSHCVGCHNWILDTKDDPAAIARNRERFPDWDRYLTNIVHFTALPDLGTLTRRVKPSFIREYLDAPYDLRPHLDESMIRVRLSAVEKDDVVSYLSELNGAKHASKTMATPSAARIAKGRSLFERGGCASCHLVGNLELGSDYTAAFYTAMKSAALLAPNLRHTKDRMTRDALVRFIADPQAVDPTATMPKPELDAGDIERIADFLLHGAVELDAPDPPPTAAEIPLLDRKVSYDEVFDRVLGQICVHCHMNPDTNNGDGGPGNTGGLGWEGIGLDLETYDGARRGLLRDGKRVSVLDAGADGQPPPLLQSLLRRHDEAAARDARPAYGDRETTALDADERPGMPMGLPPLGVDDMSLIKT